MKNKSSLHRCTQVGCNSVFNRPYRLAAHLLGHKNVKSFKCPEKRCNRAYSNNSHLIRHIKSFHKKCETDSVFCCPTCLKVYANRQNLKRHIKLYHTLNAIYTCDMCRQEFKKKNQLTAHMFQHTGVKAFSCEQCLMSFVTLYEKKRHLRFHKSYSCSECSQTFGQWSKYQKHRKLAHREKEFICDHCERSFKKRIHILRHIKTHVTGIHRFVCPFEECCRSYLRKSNLNQHINIKHNKKTHNCLLCDAKLSTKAKLQLHNKKIHSEHTSKQNNKNKVRRERKDKGSFKSSTALKLAGIQAESEILNVLIPVDGVNI